MPDPLRVLIAGRGVVGLGPPPALPALAGDLPPRTLLSPEQEFVYRPMAVGDPFARGAAKRPRLDEIAADTGAELVAGRLAAVDAGAGRAALDDGAAIE